MNDYRKTIDRHNLNLKKKLGQNFLVDSKVVDQLTSSLSLGSLPVLEVGPGLGFLTERLVDKFDKVVGVEIDQDLAEILRNRLDEDNLVIINQDILNFEIGKYFNNQEYIICSSLPYQISSPFIRKVCSLSNRPLEMSLLIQLEVGERLAADPGSSKRGLLSVICQLAFDVELLDRVSPNSFYPQPKVDSVIVNFKPRPDQIRVDNYEDFINFVGQGFRHKRKKLINSLLRSSYNLDRLAWQKLLRSTGVNGDLRAEDLANGQWLDIFESLNQKPH